MTAGDTIESLRQQASRRTSGRVFPAAGKHRRVGLAGDAGAGDELSHA
jgi:hypothetical protein